MYFYHLPSSRSWPSYFLSPRIATGGQADDSSQASLLKFPSSFSWYHATNNYHKFNQVSNLQGDHQRTALYHRLHLCKKPRFQYLLSCVLPRQLKKTQAQTKLKNSEIKTRVQDY